MIILKTSKNKKGFIKNNTIKIKYRTSNIKKI